MVRTVSNSRTARNQLQESTDSEDSDNQPSTSRSTRQAPRKQQEKQPSKQQEKQPNTRSRKQTQPKKQQEPLRPNETPLLREIRYLQQRPENDIIPKAPFGRVIREIIQSNGDFRITKEAFDCLKEATESYFVELFEDSYRLALHRKRVTLVPADMSLVLYLRGHRDPGFAPRT